MGGFSTFDTASNSTLSGALSFRITSAVGSAVQMLATVVHGQFCNVAAGCRTAGVSSFYYDATVTGEQCSALYERDNGWAGITDVTFTRQDLTGKVGIVGGILTFSGRYGAAGNFTVARRCQATDCEFCFFVFPFLFAVFMP